MICSDIGCHKSANPHIPIFIICLRVYIIIISCNFEFQHYSVICCHHNVILDTLERSVGRMGIWVAADVAANDARCIQMLAWATTTDVPYSRQWVKINQINGPFSCIDSAELSCIRPLFAQCLMLYSDITMPKSDNPMLHYSNAITTKHHPDYKVTYSWQVLTQLCRSNH